MMQQVYELLDRMLAKSPEDPKQIILTTDQCIRICRQYSITGAQLQMYIIQYCFDKDVNLEEYEPEYGEVSTT